MVRQTVLPFKLERTHEAITAGSGLTLYDEFMQTMELEVNLRRIAQLAYYGHEVET